MPIRPAFGIAGGLGFRLFDIIAVRLLGVSNRHPVWCNHQPMPNCFGHLDLAGRRLFGLHVVGHLEHGLFQVFSCASPAPPGLIDVNMAGRTGAGHRRNSGYPRHTVRHGTLHDTVARLKVHYMLVCR